MAERKGMVRADSDAVQGAGSFVVVRKLSYEQKRQATRMITVAHGGSIPADLQRVTEGLSIDTTYLDSNDQFTKDLLTSNVLEWNWVDFDGKPLPLPREDVAVIGQLTDEEVEFLVRLINPRRAADDEKN